MAITYNRQPNRNGDEHYVAWLDGRSIGTVVYNPRVSQWRAFKTVNGKVKCRYYDTQGGAGSWLKRISKTV